MTSATKEVATVKSMKQSWYNGIFERVKNGCKCTKVKCVRSVFVSFLFDSQ